MVNYATAVQNSTEPNLMGRGAGCPTASVLSGGPLLNLEQTTDAEQMSRFAELLLGADVVLAEDLAVLAAVSFDCLKQLAVSDTDVAEQVMLQWEPNLLADELRQASVGYQVDQLTAAGNLTADEHAALAGLLMLQPHHAQAAQASRTVLTPAWRATAAYLADDRPALLG